MLKNIIYDHAYTSDKNHRFLKELEKLGFRLEKNTVEHPGKAFCRFICFTGLKGERLQYLEFVDVRSRKMQQRRTYPGLSFRYLKDLKAYYEKLKRKQSLRPEFEHKNYEWKTNSKDHLPGWNFMTFKHKPMRSIFPWFTEYESKSKRAGKGKSPLTKVVHPNGAFEIAAVEISATPKALKFFSAILGTKIDRDVPLANGVKVCFERSSQTRLRRILIRVKSLKKFENFLGRSTLKIEKTSRGYLIKNPQKSSWFHDLEIVE